MDTFLHTIEIRQQNVYHEIQGWYNSGKNGSLYVGEVF